MWGQTIKLSDQIKRIDFLSRDQRYILSACFIITISSIAVIYYSSMQIILLPIVLVLNYFLLSKLLVSRSLTQILAKMIRPSLWLIIMYAYIYTILSLFPLAITWFVLINILITIGYGAMLYQDIRVEPRVNVDNVLSVLIIIFGISLASLLLAFWQWPTALVMVLVWLVMFFTALSWLLDFTDRPYLISSVWSLIAVEIFWICSRWINLYHIPQTSLLLSQSALILSALAYGFGGLYYHFKNKTLKRSLLFEYIGVTTAVFIALMLLSKWAVAV
ncbi:MAG: hypothetical protein WCK87_01920 [Candidatus Saccharibacteria bacterium]